jgi:hypothetical protein
LRDADIPANQTDEQNFAAAFGEILFEDIAGLLLPGLRRFDPGAEVAAYPSAMLTNLVSCIYVETPKRATRQSGARSRVEDAEVDYPT